MEPYGASVIIEKMHTSNTTYSIIRFFNIYVAPNYSMTTYFTAPPPAQMHECMHAKDLMACLLHKKCTQT